jgi:hypothetical protein
LIDESESVCSKNNLLKLSVPPSPSTKSPKQQACVTKSSSFIFIYDKNKNHKKS